MGNELTELRARQIVQRMHRLRDQVEVFATHARILRQSAASLDGLALLQEADNLLRGLAGSRGDFQDIEANVPYLSSRPPATGGMAPAAQWGSEFRAGSRQFVDAVRKAEKELTQLYGVANAQLNSPTRVSTAPDNIFEVLLTFMDALKKWIEYRRRPKH